jgi:CheY-like chemotaxis protein
MSASPTKSSEQVLLSGRRILVIEDEYFLAEDIVRELKLFGAQVIGPVGQFDEAARIVEGDGALDGAIVDINLHTEMIFPVARALRLRRVPFVFASGYGMAAIEPEFRDVVLWEKPLDIAAMARELAGLIQKVSRS